MTDDIYATEIRYEQNKSIYYIIVKLTTPNYCVKDQARRSFHLNKFTVYTLLECQKGT
jgi:hypothetical protein